ncbi:MAG TPA: hypothetical protein VLI55_21865 [Bryobacteraceae bacterium]|nr:hypothetical protein [Bryobacteraceae bacterium]
MTGFQANVKADLLYERSPKHAGQFPVWLYVQVTGNSSTLRD